MKTLKIWIVFLYSRSNLTEEERKLQTVRTLVTRKKATLNAAKSKAQKLKEQLEVAERIVAVSEKQIETHNQQVVYFSQKLIVFELTYYRTQTKFRAR